MKKNLLDNLTPADLEEIKKLLDFGKKIKKNPRLMYDLGLKIGITVLERSVERLKKDLNIK